MVRKKTSTPGVFTLGNGRYEIRVFAKCPKTGKEIRAVRRVEARSVAEARAQREELRGQLVARKAPVRRRRFDDAARLWLSSKLPSWKASTRVQNASVLDNHILPLLGPYWVDMIEVSDLVTWRDQQKASPESVNSRLRLLRQVLGDVRSEIGMDNPALKVARVRVPLSHRGEYIPTAEEAAALLNWFRSERPQWYPLVELLAMTGLRFGEATCLKWSDINPQAGTISIHRAHWNGVVDHPKSKVARRSVVLVPALAETLAAHQRLTGRLGGSYIFLGRSQNLHRPSVLHKPMRSALKACALDGKRVPAAKVWRKVHNNLLRQVTTEAVRQALMGHADESVGLNHYTQVGDDEKRTAVAAVVRLVRP